MSVNAIIEKASGKAEAAWGWVRGVSHRVARAFQPAPATLVVELDAKDLHRVRQDELMRFYERYEDLVELLCDAAQYGPDTRMEQRYDELRSFMLRSYGSVRPYVVAYLDIDVSDVRLPADLNGQATDAFEALYIAPTLQEQLRGDDGNLIGRIMRTREALNRYAEQLRRLAA